MSTNPEGSLDATVASLNGLDVDEAFQVLLASRILKGAEACDLARDSKVGAYKADEFQQIADALRTNLAVIAELERIWEALYGKVPSLLEVHQAAGRAKG